jgi:hypothetical protein
MKKENKEVILNIIGIFLIIFSILAISYAAYRGMTDLIFWFCYIGMIIIGIGCLTKNDTLIASQINLTAGFLIFWIIDFFYILFTNQTLFGITNYFFNEPILIPKLFSLEHFFLLPISIYALYLVSLKSKDFWKISIIQATIIFLILRILNISENNVNCSFISCVSFIQNNSFYILNWFIIVFSMVFITNFILVKLFYNKSYSSNSK